MCRPENENLESCYDSIDVLVMKESPETHACREVTTEEWSAGNKANRKRNIHGVQHTSLTHHSLP